MVARRPLRSALIREGYGRQSLSGTAANSFLEQSGWTTRLSRMYRFVPTLLLLTLLLGACAPRLLSTETAIASTSSSPIAETPPLAVDNSSCGYQWAYQGLLELSAEFLQAMQELQPGAQANAFVFGEDCVHTD